MIIRTERSDSESSLIAAFRATFDASVMNFGAYNLLYAHNLSATDISVGGDGGTSSISAQEEVAAASALIVGYRREPVELVLCPVQVDRVLAGLESEVEAQVEVPVLVNLTNLAGMTTEGTTVTVTLSTGVTVVLDILETVAFPQLPEIPLRQHRDVEDFDAFLDHFMDRVERQDQLG